MAPRSLVALLLGLALTTGCASAPAARPAAPWTPPDPEHWHRVACRLGMYPEDVDARALARARYEDLRALHEGAPAPRATERVQRARAEFDARCATWRADPGVTLASN